MKGLDTNVLVRFLVDAEGNREQQEIAADFVHAHCTVDEPCYVSIVALCELSWVLQSAYRVPRADIVDHFTALLDAQQLIVEGREIARRALADYRESDANFADHMIAWLGKAAGADETATFDKRAGVQPLFKYIGM